MLEAALATMQLVIPTTRITTLTPSHRSVRLKLGLRHASRVVLGANLIVEARIRRRRIKPSFGDVRPLWLIMRAARGRASSGAGPG